MNPHESDRLLRLLKERFDDNPHRHQGHTWRKVLAGLEANPAALESLNGMEASGGEPDMIGYDESIGRYMYCDCSDESPSGRRSLCYDRDALDSRMQNKPSGSAVEAAAAMGLTMLDEAQYRELQRLGEFDRKTSSRIATPQDVRSLGGALFCDRRYGRVYVYCNGAESYYAVRGFRGLLGV